MARKINKAGGGKVVKAGQSGKPKLEYASGAKVVTGSRQQAGNGQEAGSAPSGSGSAFYDFRQAGNPDYNPNQDYRQDGGSQEGQQQASPADKMYDFKQAGNPDYRTGGTNQRFDPYKNRRNNNSVPQNTGFDPYEELDRHRPDRRSDNDRPDRRNDNIPPNPPMPPDDDRKPIPPNPPIPPDDDRRRRGWGSNSADERSIRNFNRGMERRDFLQQYVGDPAGRVFSSPGKTLMRAREQGEDEATVGENKMRDYMSIPYTVGANLVAAERQMDEVDHLKNREGFVEAGDRTMRIMGIGKHDLSEFDPANLTEGDLAVFDALRKNPNVTDARLAEIRMGRNAEAGGGKIDLSVKKYSRKIHLVEKAVRMNAAEEYAEKMIAKYSGLFSKEEAAVLAEENSIFKVGNFNDLKRREEIINKILSSREITGNLSGLNWRKMSARDISDLLKGRTGIRINDQRIIGLLEIKQHNRGTLEIIQKSRKGVSGRPSVTHMLAGRLTAPLMEDPELSTVTRSAGAGLKAAGYAVHIGTGTAGVAYEIGNRTVEVAGKGAIKGLNAIGEKEAAEKLSETGKRIRAAQENAKKRAEELKNLPGEAIRTVGRDIGKLLATAGSAIANTRLGQAVSNSTVAKGASKAFSTAGGLVRRIAIEPIRATVTALDKAASAVTHYVRIAAIALGVWLIVMVVYVGLFTSTSGSASMLGGTVMDSEENFVDFQSKYDAQDAIFQGQVSSIVNGYAQTTNLKGLAIPYGINFAGLEAAGITLEGEYKNGVTLNYYYDGDATTGISSNIEDCLSAMAVIMGQQQSSYHTEAVELLEAIYKSTHSYTTTESALYPCTNGCEISHYYCNEVQLNYPSTDLRFSPWVFADIYKPVEYASQAEPGQECVVCRSGEKGEIPYDQYAGCTVVGTCYHKEDEGGNLGRRKPTECTNYEAIYECPGHEHEDSDGNSYTTYCSGPLGCEGYYECQGHDHWGCPEGHDIAACYGHTDLTMDIYIASLNRIFEMGGITPVEDGASAESAESSETEAGSAEGGDGT